MSIGQIQLKNFRCFSDSADIPLAPLTVIFGRNNSGKSTILQSLLLLRQTLDSPEYGPRLNLRGLLFDAGTYGDLVHKHDTRRNIVLSFKIILNKKYRATDLVMEFSSDEPQQPKLATLSISHNTIGTLVIRRGRGKGGPYELLIKEQVIGNEKTAGFFFPVNSFLPIIAPNEPKVGQPSKEQKIIREVAIRSIDALQVYLGNIRAVGPFRNQPLRRYDYHGRVPDVVDLAGKFVVDTLIEDSTRRGRRGELLRNVNAWLKQVGRIRLMPIKRISRAARIFEVRLRDTDSGRWANFADVGFGIGQALPVLVEGLRTNKEGTFIVQEPEIHLHPDAQLQMADFLVGLVREGRRVIVETHSENILLRIRKCVLNESSKKRRGCWLASDELSIVHVSKSKDGTSNTSILDMDNRGVFTNWPPGFMDEAAEERLEILEKQADLAACEIGKK